MVVATLVGGELSSYPPMTLNPGPTPPTRTAKPPGSDYRGIVHDEPIDPFHGGPSDPASELERLGSDHLGDPLSDTERQDVLEDLTDLEVYQALLAPTGIRGLVVECEECREPHYFDWDLLRGNLRHLLDSGMPRVHEPAFNPDPDRYVSWDYARGYCDGVQDTLADD